MEAVLHLDILVYIAENYTKKTMLWFTSRTLFTAFIGARQRAHIALYGPRFDTLLVGNTGDKWCRQFMAYQKIILAFKNDAKRCREKLTLGPLNNTYMRRLIHELCDALDLVHKSVHDHSTTRSVCSHCLSPHIRKRRDFDGYESQDEFECDGCHKRTYWRFACITEIDVHYKNIIIRRDIEPSKRETKRALNASRSVK
jgi:hypothetical protein